MKKLQKERGLNIKTNYFFLWNDETRNNWKFTKKKARKQIKEIKRIKIEIEKNKKMIYLD
jgi:hypothetical protein